MKKVLKFLIITIFSILSIFVLFLSYKVQAEDIIIEIVSTNAGEDCSTQMRFAWHSSISKCKFYITDANDTSFAKAKVYDCEGVYDDVTFVTEKQTEKFYKFSFNLDDLTPGANYIYKISAESTYSDVYTFSTPDKSGYFNFIWSSDNHTNTETVNPERYQYMQKLVGLADENIDNCLIVQSGDNVITGGRYESWRVNESTGIFKNHVFASIMGNHETNRLEGGYCTDDWDKHYRTMFNNPKNNPSDTDASYWYIYNSVLFVAIDSIVASHSSTAKTLQKSWFKDVVAKNEGKYQYLIVYEHYPWLNGLTGGLSGPYGTNRNVWKEVFEECKVDLALNGDQHIYYRSKAINSKDEIVDYNDPTGTVYIGAPQMGKRDRIKTDDQNPEYFEVRSDDKVGDDGTSGITYFKVTTKGITGTLIDLDGKVIDTYTIPAKRKVAWDDDKDNIGNNLVFTSVGTNGYINFNSNYVNYINMIRVMDSTGNVIKTVKPREENCKNIVIENLELNKAHNFNVEIEFNDNTIKKYSLSGNTYGDIGEIYGFNVAYANLNYGVTTTVSFNFELKNDAIKKFKVYKNDELIDTFVINGENKYNKVFDSIKPNANDIYYLYGYDKDENVIYKALKEYSLFGDINTDGVFDNSDLTNSVDRINTNELVKGNALLLTDFNQDNVFDIGDIILMNINIKNNVGSIKDKYYTVVFLDFDGNVESVQTVKEFDDAILPDFDEIEGYSFDYLSSSYKKITKDTIIKAVYKAE